MLRTTCVERYSHMAHLASFLSVLPPHWLLGRFIFFGAIKGSITHLTPY